MATKKPPTSNLPVPVEFIERRIYLIRGLKVMLETHLAELYEVTTGALNQAVKRNPSRFPEDFMFQLTKEEAESLKSQIVISNAGRGGRRRSYPYAFTEQGIAMLSSVLNSERAITVNIAIMRTFVEIRKMLLSNEELNRKISQLEQTYNKNFKVVFDTLRKLLAPAPDKPKRQIGFKTDEDKK